MATWQTPLGARVEILVADSPAPRVPPHPGCHCVRWALKPARFPSWLQFILLLASCPQAWGVLYEAALYQPVVAERAKAVSVLSFLVDGISLVVCRRVHTC